MELLEGAVSAASLLVILHAMSVLVRCTSWNTHKINYPPVAGTVVDMLLNFSRLQDFLTGISRRHKTFRIIRPGGSYVFTVDPANVEHVLKTNFAGYGKGNFLRCITEDLVGDGIFAVDGEKWRHQRKVGNYIFSTKILRDYSSEVFKSHATELAKVISDAARSNNIIDIQDLLRKATMDSILKLVFGVETKTLNSTCQEARAFAKAFDDASFQVMRRSYDVSWKIKRFLNVGSEATMKTNIKTINNFVYKLIDDKRDELTEHRDEFMKKEDILSRLLVGEKDPESMNDRYLRDLMLSFMAAGRDTTAGTLSWFFYMLCKHPDVQEKVAKEVREAANMGEKAQVTEFSSCLTAEAQTKMQYLHAALSETLRLFPAVPLDPKSCSKNDILPDGFEVSNGDIIIYLPYAMGRMEFLWGEDADLFRPERWLNDDGVFEPESPFKFIAFQAGPRICLGKEFAYRQMKVVAATLLFYFKFELWDKNKPINYKTMITLEIDGGLFLRALRRLHFGPPVQLKAV